MRVIEESLPDAGSADFKVIHYETEMLDDAPVESVIRVAPANGYLEDTASHHRTAVGMAMAAEHRGVPMRITTHDSPLAGPRAYGIDYRTERFESVVRHATEDGDFPVRFLGHSWGLPQVVMLGHTLLDAGKEVSSVVGHNPNGLTPITLTPMAIKQLILAGVNEVRIATAAARELAELSDIPMSSGLGQRALQHITGNVAAAYSEGVNLLTSDYTPQAASLWRRLSEVDGTARMHLFAGSRDGICPSQPMRDNLARAGYPESSFTEIDTFHSGPLADTRLTPLLYRAVMLEYTDATDENGQAA